MLFNSLDFALFLPIVFILYWFVTNNNLKLQNSLIVISSYFFYGWWDWRFLLLLFCSTLVDYFVALKLDTFKTKKGRLLLLWVSIVVNLGSLAFFKYFNFFLDNFNTLFSFFGKPIQVSSLNIILPVGISFYTFQTLSYTIDVYKRKLEPKRDFVAFAAFVSFFPQLVAGPIERATNLLPQFHAKRTFRYGQAVDGCRQILWGLFKKVVIADNCATYVNMVFENYSEQTGSTLMLAAILFAFQIYGDFSGYSDIAIGTARLFGFSLMRNFNFPYFSRDFGEFWRRWHISLSTWFRDYLYIPLGGSEGNRWTTLRNVLIIFVVSGFWHGANWTFVAWGILHTIYFIPLLLLQKNRQHLGVVDDGRIFPSFKNFLRICSTFMLTVIAWIFFRSPHINDAFSYIGGMFSKSLFTVPYIENKQILPLPFIGLLVALEWLQRDKQHALQLQHIKYNRSFRWVLYCTLILIIVFFGGQSQEFIYFQF